ncbi:MULTISPECIES: ArsC family reductase [Methylocaldum]|jgi:arsenate reductase|uniref:ArsC family reductase n=1 Tax=unclassified Methylocaldum TaxID=2622260 RepID=UPI00098B5A6C|nr:MULTISPECIES: ArsC family reductase [unclassified Methylocaldum]MBP1151704.1 Spx/MgsR family transcriptional regulator [Methylocaldum sp. RMAD-M]MVF24565.1 ArsC family reductase [Methylocaldum sp. BRCS4]
MIVLYGIRNCDTCKKARAWLDARGLIYRFHDFREDGLELSVLEDIERALGWELLLNRRSTTWRQLSDADRLDLNREKALQLMVRLPTLIKRPVLKANNKILSGFSPEQYEKTL